MESRSGSPFWDGGYIRISHKFLLSFSLVWTLCQLSWQPVGPTEAVSEKSCSHSVLARASSLAANPEDHEHDAWPAPALQILTITGLA